MASGDEEIVMSEETGRKTRSRRTIVKAAPATPIRTSKRTRGRKADAEQAEVQEESNADDITKVIVEDPETSAPEIVTTDIPIDPNIVSDEPDTQQVMEQLQGLIVPVNSIDKQDENSSTNLFEEFQSDTTQHDEQSSIEKDEIVSAEHTIDSTDNVFIANLAAEENANSFPSGIDEAEDILAEENALKCEMPLQETKENEQASGNVDDKLEDLSRNADNIEMSDEKSNDTTGFSGNAIAEIIGNGDENSKSTSADLEAEIVSEEELPAPVQSQVQYAEEVSDEELPGPKLAELPADIEVVSEDELPANSKKEPEIKEAEFTADTEVVSDDELPSNKKEKTKRKLLPEDYDPSSPTETAEAPEKKTKLEAEPEQAPKEEVKKVLPDLDKYWKAVNDDSTDFTAWTYLLQYVDQENDIEAAREAYDAFLAHYPYCYGYWRKYADYEKRKGNKKKCEEVFERGLKAIPLSVDLWIHYLTHVKTNYADDANTIRTQFERAIASCGLEFRSDKLWEAYIKWENESKNIKNIVAIYDRLLATPTQGYNNHFDNFKEIVNSNAVHSLVSTEEFLKLKLDTRESLKKKAEDKKKQEAERKDKKKDKEDRKDHHKEKDHKDKKDRERDSDRKERDRKEKDIDRKDRRDKDSDHKDRKDKDVDHHKDRKEKSSDKDKKEKSKEREKSTASEKDKKEKSGSVEKEKSGSVEKEKGSIEKEKKEKSESTEINKIEDTKIVEKEPSVSIEKKVPAVKEEQAIKVEDIEIKEILTDENITETKIEAMETEGSCPLQEKALEADEVAEKEVKHESMEVTTTELITSVTEHMEIDQNPQMEFQSESENKENETKNEEQIKEEGNQIDIKESCMEIKVEGSSIKTDEQKPVEIEVEADDHVNNEEEAQGIKDKIISKRKKIHKGTIAAVTARWTFEEGIKRPYFHVKPLERCQLKNWKEYIDFEIEQGDQKRVLVLFERCLIACALYDEFWLKLIRYLDSKDDPDIIPKTRDAYERACIIHHPDKPSLHLMWSAFEETHENPAKAAEILANLEKSHPNLMQVAYRRINLERRRGDMDKCIQLYDQYISQAKNKAIAGNIAIKYARFLHKLKHDIDSGYNVLKNILEKDPSNTRVALQMIDLALQRDTINETEIVNILDNFMARDNIELDQKVLFAQRKVEFLEDFGSNAKDLQEAQKTLQSIMNKANEAKKKRESSPPKKSSSVKDTTATAQTNATYAANSYTYSNPSQSYYSNSAGAQAGYQQYGDGYNYNQWNQQYSQSTAGYGNYSQWSGYTNYY